MLRLTAEKTYRVFYYILENPSFSQIDIHKETKISTGRISKIINWLKERSFVTKRNAKFKLIQPNKLIQLISLYTKLTRTNSFFVKLDKNQANILIKKHGILCLESALKQTDTIQAYCTNNKLIEELNKTPRGSQKIELYSSELPIQENFDPKSRTTTEIRTIIDLRTVDKQELTQDIAKKLWRTLQ